MLDICFSLVFLTVPRWTAHAIGCKKKRNGENPEKKRPYCLRQSTTESRGFMWGTGLLVFVSSRDGVLRDETKEGCEKDFNTRQKSWNTRVSFPFPSVDLGIIVVSVLQNNCGVNIGEGEGHIWVRTKARRVNVRNVPQNSRQMVSVSTICDEYYRSP